MCLGGYFEDTKLEESHKKAIQFQSQLPPAALMNRIKTHTVHQNLPLSEIRLLSHCLAFHCHSSIVAVERTAPEISSFIFIESLTTPFPQWGCFNLFLFIFHYAYYLGNSSDPNTIKFKASLDS